MSFQGLETRFRITSEKSDVSIANRTVGSAYRADDQNYYTLHFRILPGITFFVVPSEVGFPEYVIFSGRAKKDCGSYRFFHPIGSGYRAPNENLIELWIPDLSKKFYIHLNALDYHFTEKIF